MIFLTKILDFWVKIGQNRVKNLKIGQNRVKNLKNGQNRVKNLKIGQNRVKNLKIGQNRVKNLKIGQNRVKNLKIGQNRVKNLNLAQFSIFGIKARFLPRYRFPRQNNLNSDPSCPNRYDNVITGTDGRSAGISETEAAQWVRTDFQFEFSK